MSSKSEFECVKDFNKSVEYICKDIWKADVINDIKIVGDYVLDSVFAHEKENMMIDMTCNELTLRQMKRYNKLYQVCFNEDGKMSSCASQADLLNLYMILMKGMDICVARSVEVKEDEEKEEKSTSDANANTNANTNANANANKVSHRYKLADISMLGCEYKIGPNGEKISGIVDFVNCNPLGSYVPIQKITDSNRYYDKLEDIPRAKLLPFSIPQIHSEEDFYVKYFTDNDFNHNKLRTVIIELVRGHMNEISRYIDEFNDLPDCYYEDEVSDKGYPFNNIETIKLLIEYAIKLYEECDTYLKDKVFGEKIELKV